MTQSFRTGCSKILEKGQATSIQSKKGYEQLMSSFVGTKVYAAPEILRHKPYDSSVDEYSTGVLARARRPGVLWFLCRVCSAQVALLLTGKHPLSDIEVDTNLALASCDVPFLIDFSDKEWSRVNKRARASDSEQKMTLNLIWWRRWRLHEAASR